MTIRRLLGILTFAAVATSGAASAAMAQPLPPLPIQDGQVLPEIAGGQVEGGAQEAELHAPGLVGDGEDAEPDPLMNDIIQAIDRMLGHDTDRRARRSASAKLALPSSSTAAVICGPLLRAGPLGGSCGRPALRRDFRPRAGST